MPAMQNDDPTIKSALDLIGEISPVGREKLKNKLKIAGLKNEQDLAVWMHEADNLAYFFQGSWKTAARALDFVEVSRALLGGP